MRIFAIGDLHLSFSCDKPMEVFGPQWENHVARLEASWQQSVGGDDLVLIPGDISWAMHLADAAEDLSFIGRLNGTKLLLRGNHDYWWNSITQVRKALPPNVYAIQNDAKRFGDYVIGGTRLWTPPNPQSTAEDAKIYARELARLELSLSAMPDDCEKIIMVHFPPFDEHHAPSPATELFERYGVRHVIYAHLHGKAHRLAFSGEKNGVNYIFAAADYLQFQPISVV